MRRRPVCRVAAELAGLMPGTASSRPLKGEAGTAISRLPQRSTSSAAAGLLLVSAAMLSRGRVSRGPVPTRAAFCNAGEIQRSPRAPRQRCCSSRLSHKPSSPSTFCTSATTGWSAMESIRSRSVHSGGLRRSHEVAETCSCQFPTTAFVCATTRSVLSSDEISKRAGCCFGMGSRRAVLVAAREADARVGRTASSVSDECGRARLRAVRESCHRAGSARVFSPG